MTTTTELKQLLQQSYALEVQRIIDTALGAGLLQLAILLAYAK